MPELSLKDNVDDKLSNDKISHYCLYAILLTIIVYYLVTRIGHGTFHATSLIAFAVAIGIMVLQSVSRFLPVTKNWAFFNSGGLGGIMSYNIGIAIILIAYLPLYSPFVLVLPPLMFITVYYRGVGAYLISVGYVTSVVIVYSVLHGIPSAHGSEIFPFAIVILSAAYAGIVARAGNVETKLRQEFIVASGRAEEERQQLSSLVNSIPAAVIATDNKGNILFTNKSASLFLDSVEEGEGPQYPRLIPMYDKKEIPVSLLDLAQAQENQRIQLRDIFTITKGHERIALGVDVSTIQSKAGAEKTGYILILRDITKEKSLEEERNEFISITSHELRTPIATAEASLSLILSPAVTKELDPKVKERVKYAYDSITYLADLTNQLAILSQAESQSLEFAYEFFEPNQLLESLGSEFKTQADKKELTFTVKPAPGLAPIRTSKVYVEEILRNFLSNAIKYTDDGGDVLFEVNKAGSGEEIIFSVKDTGIGISESDKSKVFAKYYRAEDFRTRETGGTGLGLYLSYKLAEYLKGKAWFSSEKNKGSTFYLQIPNIIETKKPEVSAPAPAPESSAASLPSPVTAISQ